MDIPVSHVNIQNINCIIFDADARDRTNEGRARLLQDLTVRARNAGLAVAKRALRFSECGRVTYYGDPDLVGYLRSNGWGLRSTHTLTVS